MCPCSLCKKPFEEIDLTWLPVSDTFVLLCDDCNKSVRGERESQDSGEELGPRDMDGQ